MSLSSLPGPWRWEQRGDSWWRVNDRFHVEDGPHPEPIKVATDDIIPMLESTCAFCEEPIFLGIFNTWHHEDKWGYVVCAFGLDTDQPGELVAHYAKPKDSHD